MRLRALLMGLVLGALLVAVPYVAEADSSRYELTASTLRATWDQDLQAGVPASSLSPLQQELASYESQTAFGLPSAYLWPGAADGELTALQHRTSQAYSTALSQGRAQALASLASLRAAWGTISSTQEALWRQEQSDASTPADWASLAAVWSLQAEVLPYDRKVFAQSRALDALIAQAKNVGVSTSDAALLQYTTTWYFQLDDATRLADAPSLLTSYSAQIASLQAQVSAALAAQAKARAARAAAAAAAAHHRAPVVSAPLYLPLAVLYADCTGGLPTVLPAGLFEYMCVVSTIYLVSDNWSVGRAFFALHVGSRIYYNTRWYTVSSVTVRTPAQESAHVGFTRAILTLQTNWNASGSELLIIEAS